MDKGRGMIIFDKEAALRDINHEFYGEYASQLDVNVYEYIAKYSVLGDLDTLNTTNSEIKKAIHYSGKAEDIGKAIAYLRAQRILWYKHQDGGNKRFRRGSGRYKARAVQPAGILTIQTKFFKESMFDHFKSEEMR